MSVEKITTEQVVALRKKKWKLDKIADWFEVSKQAIHYRLRMAGQAGLLPKQCLYCKRWKVKIYKQTKWGRICQSCFDVKKGGAR